MIILDASILIAHLDETDIFHQQATRLLNSVADQQLAASTITMAEVLAGPARIGQLDRAMSILDQLRVRSLPLSEDSSLRLAALRSETRLKLPDCCVLVAADQARDTGLASFDDRLRSAARSRGLKVLPE